MHKVDKQITEWTITPSQELELVLARMGPNGLSSHFHDSWSIGAILEGSCNFQAGGHNYQAHTGDLFFIPPFEVHACAAKSTNMQYIVLYVTGDYLSKIKATQFFNLADTNQRTFPAPSLMAHMNALNSGTVDMQHAEYLLRALATVLPAPPEKAATRQALHPMQIIMHQLWQSDVTIYELEKHSRHSRAHTIRTFHQKTGLSPSAYLRQLRAIKARFFLQEKTSLSDMAQFLNFSDQAHFTRIFKSVYGVTPGHLRNIISRNSMQKLQEQCSNRDQQQNRHHDI